MSCPLNAPLFFTTLQKLADGIFSVIKLNEFATNKKTL
jgi:hypothetical protein